MTASDLINTQQTLHPEIWNNGALSSRVASGLMTIAKSFAEKLQIDEKALEDITFTGSLANYNWTKFSDIDLHLIVDFSQVDENLDLVREYFSAKSSNWNRLHKIMIFGHEVEIYVQNAAEPHHSTGVYSILNKKWLQTPQKFEKVNFGMEEVKRKANSFIDMLERADDFYLDKNYEQANEFAVKLMDKLKNFRQSGLESEGERSLENLTFKYLRNNGHIKFLHDLRNRSFDKMMSLNGDYKSKFKIFINKYPVDLSWESTGFNKLNEMEKFKHRLENKQKRMQYLSIPRGFK